MKHSLWFKQIFCKNVNTANAQWKIYRTRVVSTANQVNLDFEEAQTEISKGLAKSLSGLL